MAASLTSCANVRCTPGDLERIRRAAQCAGMDVSTWGRKVLLSAAGEADSARMSLADSIEVIRRAVKVITEQGEYISAADFERLEREVTGRGDGD